METMVEQPPKAERTFLWRRGGTKAAAAFLVIWSACAAFLAFAGGNFLFPISSLLLFGVVLTGLIVFLTRKTLAPAVPVAFQPVPTWSPA